MTDEAPETSPHPVDRYLERAIDTEADFKALRRRVLDALEQLAQSFANNLDKPPSLKVASELWSPIRDPVSCAA